MNVATELVYMPDQDLVAYTLAKAALLSFSKSLASALASDGVLVNVVRQGLWPRRACWTTMNV